MKPLHTRLQEARHRLQIPWEVLERDYLLSWILAGIAQVRSLRDTLVFKGGTSLKKCYFGGDYRFSEDLDFTGVGGVSNGTAMERDIRLACNAAARLLNEYAPVDILCEKCAIRNVSFKGPDDFFPETMIAHVGKTWDQWLGPLVPGLPSFQTVTHELRPQIVNLFLSHSR